MDTYCEYSNVQEYYSIRTYHIGVSQWKLLRVKSVVVVTVSDLEYIALIVKSIAMKLV